MAGAWRTKITKSSKDNLSKLRAQLPAAGNPRAVILLAGEAKGLIVQRTAAGKDSSGQGFSRYSDRPYYAPVEKRPPGYPKPSGGRTESLRTGKKMKKKMKTVFYGGGYGAYKSAIGRGQRPQLSVSGKMLGAIQIAQTGPRKAILFFAGREEAAKAHGHEFGTAPKVKRSFFDVSHYQSVAELRGELAKYMIEAGKRAKLFLNPKGF